MNTIYHEHVKAAEMTVLRFCYKLM